MNDVLEVAVYDWDQSGNNDFLGHAAIPVQRVVNSPGPVSGWFPLTERHSAKPTRGQIQLTLIWTDSNGVKRTGAAAGVMPGAMPMQVSPRIRSPLRTVDLPCARNHSCVATNDATGSDC